MRDVNSANGKLRRCLPANRNASLMIGLMMPETRRTRSSVYNSKELHLSEVIFSVFEMSS